MTKVNVIFGDYIFLIKSFN